MRRIGLESDGREKALTHPPQRELQQIGRDLVALPELDIPAAQLGAVAQRAEDETAVGPQVVARQGLAVETRHQELAPQEVLVQRIALRVDELHPVTARPIHQEQHVRHGLRRSRRMHAGQRVEARPAVDALDKGRPGDPRDRRGRFSAPLGRIGGWLLGQLGLGGEGQGKARGGDECPFHLGPGDRLGRQRELAGRAPVCHGGPGVTSAWPLKIAGFGHGRLAHEPRPRRADSILKTR